MMASEQVELATIETLPLEFQSDYVPFLIGNDTPLTHAMIAPHKMDRDFVLIGTALFRSIDIACHLTQKDTAVIPKVVIIDNSRNTSIAWQHIKALFAAASPAQKYRDFLYREDGLLSLLADLGDQDLIQLDDNIPIFFMKFFEKYPFAYVQQIVSKLQVIEQNWGDADTFSKLRMIYQGKPIVAYSSNIIDFVEPETQIQILRNLAHLNPCVSFCTNLDKIKRAPTMSYVFTDSSPLTVCEALQLSEGVKSYFSGAVDALRSMGENTPHHNDDPHFNP